MTRDAVVQAFLSRFDRPRYLEIGVQDGVTFDAVDAAHKTAVDPAFRFDVSEARRRHSDCSYEECTSDAFFGARIRPDEAFQVIYLDGLHTFEQTLRDLLNSVFHLSGDGVIIIDDVLPTTYSASLPDEHDAYLMRERVASEKLDISWMGDVYKLVYFVAAFLQQFQYATTADNHGQMVLWRARRHDVGDRHDLMSDIAMMDFSRMMKSLEVFRRRPTAEIVADFDRRPRRGG